jgi:shikimate kinase
MKHFKMNKTTKIFLIGFMGSGKTSLGKKLAKKLNLPFFDLDQRIEEQEQCTITEIFNKKGEDYFRALETAVLQDTIATKPDFVLSLGGGTPCFNNNIEFINSTGTSIYLKYNAGILTSRLLLAKQERPLIANKNKEELKQFVFDLLNQREPFYHQSKLVVEGKNITTDTILKHL